MANLFAAPLISAWKHYRMVTPTEYGKVAENNGLAVSNLPEKPGFAYGAEANWLTVEAHPPQQHR